MLVLERLAPPAVPPSRPVPSPGSTRACRATRTWSACCPRRSCGISGSTSRVRSRTVSSYTPDRARRTGQPGSSSAAARTHPGRLRRGSPAASASTPPGSEFYDMTGRVAERVFPTLTEPLPTRDALRRRVDDEDGLAGPLRGTDRRGRRGALRRRPGARRRPHRRPDRHLRRRPRPVPAAEPLLPLPRHRRRHRRLGRPRRRHGRPHRRPGRRRPRGGRRSGHRARGDPRRDRRAHRRGDLRDRGRGGHGRRPARPRQRLPAGTRRPHRRRAAGARRGRPAQGQHAPRPGCRGCATRPSTRARRSPAPSTSPRATSSWRPPTRQAAAGALPAAPPVRDLLPLAHRPDHPRPGPRRARLPDAHPVRPAHPRPALRAATTTPPATNS